MCGPHHKGVATWPRQDQHTKSWELVSRADQFRLSAVDNGKVAEPATAHVSNKSAYACIKQCIAHCTHEHNTHAYASACYTSEEGTKSTA